MNSVERPDKQSQSVDWEGELASLRNHALCSADGCGCKKKSYMQLDRLLSQRPPEAASPPIGGRLGLPKFLKTH